MDYRETVIISIAAMGIIAVFAIGTALRKFSRSMGQSKRRQEEMKAKYHGSHRENQ
jgi:hypothetical protein